VGNGVQREGTGRDGKGREGLGRISYWVTRRARKNILLGHEGQATRVPVACWLAYQQPEKSKESIRNHPGKLGKSESRPCPQLVVLSHNLHESAEMEGKLCYATSLQQLSARTPPFPPILCHERPLAAVSPSLSLATRPTSKTSDISPWARTRGRLEARFESKHA
jgi:hypothetical protein